MAARDVVLTTATRLEARGDERMGCSGVGARRPEGGTPPRHATGVHGTGVLPPTRVYFNTAAGRTCRDSSHSNSGTGVAAARRRQTKAARMRGLRGFGLLSFLMLPHAAANESPYDPTCPVAPPQQLTLQGDSTGPWEDIDWLNRHGDDKLVGAAYAYVPPMSLMPGDKLAFDTSVLGTDAMNVTLSLSSCAATRTVGTENAEEGLTYTCEETLMPEHTVRHNLLARCFLVPGVAISRLTSAPVAAAACGFRRLGGFHQGSQHDTRRPDKLIRRAAGLGPS